MKRSTFAFAALAGTVLAAPAPTPVAAPAPAPAMPMASAYTAEPTPAPAPEAASTAPFAPVTDGLLQNNPAGQGSISSVLSIPHRWAEKRVAVFQWSGDAASNGSGLAYGTMDNIFAGFQVNNGRGDITGGYTTPGWAAGLKVNFGKTWRTTSDSVNGVFEANQESNASYVADGFELLGSYNMDPYHLYGALVWRTIENYGSWQTPAPTPGDHNTYSNRYDSVGVRLGARTYVTGEGLAWRAGVSYFERYLRPSGSELVPADSEFDVGEVHDFALTGDVGYRYATAGNSMFTVGLNSAFRTTNGKPDSVNAATGAHDRVDYVWTLSTRPNVGLLLPIFERWTLLGGAGVDVVYTSGDAVKGDDEIKNSALYTSAPTGSVGVRYAKEIWAVQAQVSNQYLSNGPYFLSGNDGQSTTQTTTAGTPAVTTSTSTKTAALVQLGLTVNLK